MAKVLQFLSALNVLSKSTFKSDSSVLRDLKSNFARLNDCSRVPSCFVKYSDMSVRVASGLINRLLKLFYLTRGLTDQPMTAVVVVFLSLS